MNVILCAFNWGYQSYASWRSISFQVSYGLTKLLFFLAHSPYGPLVLNDFRHQQFVLVGGEIKLTDMDDVGFQQPSCISDEHCQQYFSSSNFTIRYFYGLLRFSFNTQDQNNVLCNMAFHFEVLDALTKFYAFENRVTGIFFLHIEQCKGYGWCQSTLWF